MRFSSSLLAAYLLTQQLASVNGFSVVKNFQPSSTPSSSTALFSAIEESAVPVEAELTNKEPRKKPLSPEELLAKFGKPVDEAPKLFEESLYDDIQNILLLLERRVKEGPNSLSMLDVEDLSGMTNRVLNEMKDFDAKKENNSSGESPAPPPASTAVATSFPEQQQPAQAAAIPEPQAAAVPATPPPPAVSPQPADVKPTNPFFKVEPIQLIDPATPAAEEVATSPPPPATGAAATESVAPVVQDISEDEGPAYEGKGGMGQPKGTVNTYIIEGMDAMSSDEYLAALQASVSARHNERRQEGKAYGNRQTWDYLNNLTGDSGQLRDDA